MKVSTFPVAVLALFTLSPSLSGRTFFELANQRFQDGGRSGLRSDSMFRFNGPVFEFQEPDVFGAKAGLADRNPDGPTLWARALGGYDSNAAGIKAGDGAWFGGVQLGGSERFAVGRQNVFLGGSARFVQYDGDIFRRGRDGDDAAVFDLDLRLGLQREYTPSLVVTAFYDLNLGGYRRFGEPYLLPGVSPQNDLLWRGASQAVYRFDRTRVDDPGLQFTTALRTLWSIGLDNDDRDVRRGEVRQSLDYIVRDGLAAGLEGRFGFNTWEDWEDLDSSSWQLLATTGGSLFGAVHFHAAAGWEWWSYDEGQFLEDRDGFLAEVKLSGEVTDRFYLAGGLTYGIDTVRPGRSIDSADPLGLKAAVTGVWDYGPYSVAALGTYTWFEADLASASDGHWARWSAGLSVDREIGTTSRVGVAFEYARIDTHRDDFEDIETTLRWTTDF